MTSLPPPSRPRLGFLGLGATGCHRLTTICQANVADVVAVFDEAGAGCARALELAPAAIRAQSADALLDLPLDGIVIATPSAQHARQAIAALGRGRAVFCQMPLARTAAECRLVLDEARRADCLLGVDLPYRLTRAMSAIAAEIRAGRLGEVYAAELAFHHVSGPDQAWLYDRERSGGGCLIDLGTHLIDLAFWLQPDRLRTVSSRLFAAGRRLAAPLRLAEDYAQVIIETARGAALTVTCSWRLQAGRNALIDCRWYGTSGGVRFVNVNGSFHDFAAERFDGTRTSRLADPPDDWSGRAIVAWTNALARGAVFDPAVGSVEQISAVIDAAYNVPSPAVAAHPPEQLGAISRAV